MLWSSEFSIRVAHVTCFLFALLMPLVHMECWFVQVSHFFFSQKWSCVVNVKPSAWFATANYHQQEKLLACCFMLLCNQSINIVYNWIVKTVFLGDGSYAQIFHAGVLVLSTSPFKKDWLCYPFPQILTQPSQVRVVPSQPSRSDNLLLFVIPL